MKVTLKFDTYSEEFAFRDALNGTKYKEVIKGTLEILRKKLKYDNITDEQHVSYSVIRDEIFNLLQESNLILDDE